VVNVCKAWGEDLNSSRILLGTGDLDLGELKTIVARIESDVLHVPEELREILGRDTKIIASTAVALLFSAGTSYADVLRSLELIREDIRLRLSKEKSEASKRKRKKTGRYDRRTGPSC
jgi:hypothetical protein